MEPLLFVMAIMGCGDGKTVCTQARVTPATYQTRAQCEAAIGEQLGEHTDLSFPVIAGKCLPVTEPMPRMAVVKPARQGG